jgi:hypothetical protein
MYRVRWRCVSYDSFVVSMYTRQIGLGRAQASPYEFCDYITHHEEQTHTCQNMR